MAHTSSYRFSARLSRISFDVNPIWTILSVVEEEEGGERERGEEEVKRRKGKREKDDTPNTDITTHLYCDICVGIVQAYT